MRIKLIIFSVIVFQFLAGIASASTLVVNQTTACTTGDSYYSAIQEAVNNASDNDIIIVCPGTYIENVDVNKSVTIESYTQNPSDTIVIASNSNDHVFYITADNVTIKGFTVTGALNYNAGIYIYNSNNCTIENVNASDNWGGIFLSDSNKNIIAKNIISSNDCYGISLFNSSKNIIASNNISNNYDGIVFDFSSDNIITNNTIRSNDGVGIGLSGVTGSNNNNIITNNTISNNKLGIHISNSSKNTIAINIISNNYDGIIFVFSNANTIAKNIISSNDRFGIDFSGSNKNTITDNNILNNDYGIGLISSIENIIARNNISFNKYGIYSISLNNNIIYLNNFIDNTDQVNSSSSTNVWNSTEKITYTYNGRTYTNYLGNYWSDYTGSDANGDGIGDSPYSIDSDKDFYPLMKPWYYYFQPIPTPTLTTPSPGFEITATILGLFMAWYLLMRKR